MLIDLFPRQFDNRYRGRSLALWFLGFVAVSKVFMGLNCIFNGYYVATTADGIPLGNYTPAGAQAVLAMFAAWGLSVLIFGLLSLLVLARYRGMAPFMLALLLLEHLGRRLVFFFLPIEKIEGSRGWLVNLVLLAAIVAGLVLSLRWRQDRTTRAEGSPGGGT